MAAFLAFMDRLFNDHRVVRRSLVFWAMGIITYTVYQFFENFTMYSDMHFAVIGGIFAFLTAVIALYQWDRARDSSVAKKANDG